jgi:hypothetical protein
LRVHIPEPVPAAVLVDLVPHTMILRHGMAP